MNSEKTATENTNPKPSSGEPGAALAPILSGPPAEARKARLALISELVPAEDIQQLEEASTFFGALTDPNSSESERMLTAAIATQKLEAALGGEILKNVLLPLQGKPYGFTTDLDHTERSYPAPVVLECSVEAWLMGLPPVGGAWSIIAKRCYPRKEGFEILAERLCRYRTKIEVPPIPQEMFNEGGYLRVNAQVSYLPHRDVPDDAGDDEDLSHLYRVLKNTYSVRVNKRNVTAQEATEGKAKRKLLRDLVKVLTGRALPDADDADAGFEEDARVFQVGADFSPGDVEDVMSMGQEGQASDQGKGLSAEKVQQLKDLAMKGGVPWGDVEEVYGGPVEGLTGDAGKIEADVVEVITSRAKSSRTKSEGDDSPPAPGEGEEDDGDSGNSLF